MKKCLFIAAMLVVVNAPAMKRIADSSEENVAPVIDWKRKKMHSRHPMQLRDALTKIDAVSTARTFFPSLNIPNKADLRTAFLYLHTIQFSTGRSISEHFNTNYAIKYVESHDDEWARRICRLIDSIMVRAYNPSHADKEERKNDIDTAIESLKDDVTALAYIMTGNQYQTMRNWEKNIDQLAHVIDQSTYKGIKLGVVPFGFGYFVNHQK